MLLPTIRLTKHVTVKREPGLGPLGAEAHAS